MTDRAKPGLIAVNKEGRRFVNEAVSYHEFVRAQLRDPDRCDSGLADLRQPLSVEVRARPRQAVRAVDRARSVEAATCTGRDTLEDLARAIGVPAATLAETVRAFNADAARGMDPAFGRGANIYQRHLGDADQQPNPCVAPIERAPFHAVAVVPADLGMAAGVMTDECARALDAEGPPSPACTPAATTCTR